MKVILYVIYICLYMRKRIVLLILLLAFLINNDLIPQSKSELKNTFYDAESWILFEDFKEALPLYEQLLKSYPGNSNFLYRIGQCYINIPGEKEKAISYLEEATKNINPDYRDGKFRETGAPCDALYFLANAYRINDELDKAIETYNLFKKNLKPEIYDSNIVNLQIQSCYTAMKLIGTPVYIKETNIGKNINETNSEFNPVISDDEKMLVFSKSEAFYDAILYSTRTNGRWTTPINMNELLKVDRDFYPTSISSDGRTLYLYSTVDYDGIIYTTKFENGNWTPVTRLNDNINTKFWESHATISHDNKKLYFTSNRKGTLGGLDIYVSSRDSIGDWGPAVNLGPVINTPYNEESPFLSKDDKTLFFSSRGHYNMGGYDIFYSTLLDNGEWSVPLNVGYPLNSTDDDVFFKPLNEGYEGYLAKYSLNGFGKQDIFRIEIFTDDHPRRFFVKGLARGADLSDRVKISASNIKNPDRSYVIYTNPESGEYEFQAGHGNYEFTFEADGSEKSRKYINLPISNPSDTFIVPDIILPKTDFTADFEVEGERYITVSSGNAVTIPLKVEPRSTLASEHWVGDSLISAEQVAVMGSFLLYKLIPRVGENKVAFTLTDRFSNTATSDVFITRTLPPVIPVAIQPEYREVVAPEKPVAADKPVQPDTDTDTAISINDIKKVPEVPVPGKEHQLWYLWLVLGAGLILFLIIFLRRKKSKKGAD